MRTLSTKLILLLLAGALLGAPAVSRAGADQDFLAAREAFQRGQWTTLESWRTRLAGHVLESYPAYWLLSSRIDKADPADVRAFLSRYPDSPLAEALRRDWLRALGAAASWEEFRVAHPLLVGEDAEVNCYAFQERLARNAPEVTAEARALFLAGREAPAACDPVFAALVTSKALDETQVRERLRKLLAANLVKDAKRANALLPPRQAFHDRALDRAAAEPARFLAEEKSPILTKTQKELVLFAVQRLARSRPEEAAERLALVSGRLGPDDTRFGWGQVAYHAAMSHHPRALEWYNEAGDAALTDTQLAWKARAALRAADWPTVFAAIKALSPEEAREPNWRYWRSRALRAQGSAEAADGLLQSLSRELHFYGLLAAEELGTVATPTWNATRPSTQDLDRVRAYPGIQRSLELYRLGLDNEGFREWWWAVRTLDDRDLLAASELAAGAQLTDRSINTAERTVTQHDFAKRYPVPHREAMSASARQWSVDEAWMYGLIRQESRFMPEARSRVGATGLMQLMPATARWVARQIPVPDFNTAKLVKPEINVQMGTYYFMRVLGDLGDPILATAGYNAGPGRAKRWRAERPLEGAIYAETIPFNETRDYVKKVVANTWFYTHRLTGKAPSMRALLGKVPGRSGEPEQAALASAIP